VPFFDQKRRSRQNQQALALVLPEHEQSPSFSLCERKLWVNLISAAMDEASSNSSQVKPEQRRSNRFPVVVPVQAKWQEASGKIVVQNAQAREVNKHGGLLDMSTFPSVGSQLELTNLISNETYRARVVGVRRSADNRVLGVAIDLLIPSETFWGVNFQLRKTSNELMQLEQAIRTGGIDQRILTDFRDAVDHVRKTAWAVQEWQERQIQHHDPHTLLPLLITERIRRAGQLGDAIVADLNANEATRETPGIEHLYETVCRLHGLLSELLRDVAKLS
jgi:hypothetical protein